MTRASLLAKQKANRADIAAKAAGEGLDDAETRMARLRQIQGDNDNVTAIGPGEPAAAEQLVDQGEVFAPEPVVLVAPQPVARPGRSDEPRLPRAKVVKAAPVATDSDLLTRLTARAPRGSASNPKINFTISSDTADKLEPAEIAVLEATGRKVVRAALVTEAAERVARDPQRYERPRLGETGSPQALGNRIPPAVLKALTRATYSAVPRRQYGPMVGRALSEILDEVSTAVGDQQ